MNPVTILYKVDATTPDGDDVGVYVRAPNPHRAVTRARTYILEKLLGDPEAEILFATLHIVPDPDQEPGVVSWSGIEMFDASAALRPVLAPTPTTPAEGGQ